MIGENIAAIRKERGFTQEQLTQVVTHRLCRPLWAKFMPIKGAFCRFVARPGASRISGRPTAATAVQSRPPFIPLFSLIRTKHTSILS